MKKLIISLLFLFVCFVSSAATVTLEWCPSDDPTVTGYKIVYGPLPKVSGWLPAILDTNQAPCPGVVLFPGTNWVRTYTATNNVGNVTNTYISNLVAGTTYYFAALAYNADGIESDLSNEVEYTIPIITYLATRLEWWTNMAYINRQNFNLTSFTNAPIPQYYRSYLVITNSGISGVNAIKSRLEWYTNMAYINKQVFDLRLFTNAGAIYFYRSFLVITNKPF